MRREILKRIEKLAGVGGILFLCLWLTGCGESNYLSENAEKKQIEYTVLKESEIPDLLEEQIQDKRKEKFQMTYDDMEYQYIAVGYGEQPTGGYSIKIDELVAEGEKLYVRTRLEGPQKGEQCHKKKSYPYLVIKLEYREAEIFFE